MDRTLQEFLSQSWKSLSRLDTAVSTLEGGAINVGALERMLGVIRAIGEQSAPLELARLARLASEYTALLQHLRTADEPDDESIPVVLEALEAVKEIIVCLEATGQEPEFDCDDLVSRMRQFARRDTVGVAYTPDASTIAPTIRIHSPVKADAPVLRGEATATAATAPTKRSYLVNPRVPDHLMALVDDLNAARDQLQLSRTEGASEAEMQARIEEIQRITDELRETVATIWLQPTVGDSTRRHSSTARQDLPRTEIQAENGGCAGYDVMHPLPAIGPNTLAGLEVLVVDDSLFFRQLAIAALEAAGGSATAVPGVSEAVELLDRGESFDAVLTDVELPDVHERRFVKGVQNRQKSVPRIGLVSGTTPLGESRIQQAGFDRCVAKYHTRQIVSAIFDLCRGAEGKSNACA